MTVCLQLIDRSDLEVDLIGALLDTKATSGSTIKLALTQHPQVKDIFCFYNQLKVYDFNLSRPLSRPALMELTEESYQFVRTGHVDDDSIKSQLSWDGSYPVLLGIFCNKPGQFNEFKGHLRLLHDNRLLCEFTMDDLGDLSNTGFIQVGYTDPIQTKFRWFSQNESLLRIHGIIAKHASMADWLKHYQVPVLNELY